MLNPGGSTKLTFLNPAFRQVSATIITLDHFNLLAGCILTISFSVAVSFANFSFSKSSFRSPTIIEPEFCLMCIFAISPRFTSSVTASTTIVTSASIFGGASGSGGEAVSWFPWQQLHFRMAGLNQTVPQALKDCR